MVTVVLLDADNPDKTLVGPLSLPIEPQVSKPLYFRRRFKDKNASQALVLTAVYRYEIFTEEPERSGIAYLARQIDHD